MDRSKNSAEVTSSGFYAWKDVSLRFLRKIFYARTFLWIGLLVTFCTLSYFLTISDKIYGNPSVKKLIAIDSTSINQSPKELSDVSKFSHPENENINLKARTSENQSFNQPAVIGNEEATVSPNEPEVVPLIKHLNDDEDIKKTKWRKLQKQANDLPNAAASQKSKREENTELGGGSQEEHKVRSSYEILDQRHDQKVRQRLPVRNNNKVWENLQNMEQGLNNMLQQSPAKRALQASYDNHLHSHQLMNRGEARQERSLPKFSQSAYPELIYEDNPTSLGKKRVHYINASPVVTPAPHYIKMSHPIARDRENDNMHNLNSQMPERETTADIRNEHREQTTPTPSSTLAEEETRRTSTSRPKQTTNINMENVHDGSFYDSRRDYHVANERFVPEFSQFNNAYHRNYDQMYPLTNYQYINEANLNNRALNPSRIVSVPQQGRVFAKQQKKKVVIISTRYRSGSTFTGEMFNQNPDYFFTFEPLHSFKRKVLDFASLSDVEKGNRRRALLESIFLCNHNTDYRPAPNFLSMTKAVSKFTGCPIPETLGKKLEPDCSAKAKAVIAQPWLVPELCAKYKYSAVKTIRANISDLIQLLDHDQLDVKIVQLIRDPRGMFRSWFPKLNNNDELALMKLKRNVSSICKELLMNLYDGENLRQYRPDKYMLLRYEDLAANPVDVVKTMYSFSGTELHENVLRWIHFNTGQSERANMKKVQRRFGTFRTDSKSTATKWKTALPYSAIRIIEDNCRQFILSAGYNLFDPSTTTTSENLEQ